jgi:hypothetical protein
MILSNNMVRGFFVFLNKNYILANELVEKMGIHIANISMLRSHLEEVDDDISTIRKMGNCNFIKKNSLKLPKNIREGIYSNTFADVSNKLPCSWVKTEYEISDSELKKSGVVENVVTISGKKFYVFKDDFVKTTRNKIVYVLNEQETMDCYKKGQIDGYIKAGKRYITWY